MFVVASTKGLCLLEFVDRKMLQTEVRDLSRFFKAPIIAGENVYTQQAETEVGEYFRGTRKEFSVPLDSPGTEFQKTVWKALQNIPYGTTVSYETIARAIGSEHSVRAVGTANGANRIAIIVPCHRVIRKDGTLGGYGGGLERKRWLLEHES